MLDSDSLKYLDCASSHLLNSRPNYVCNFLLYFLGQVKHLTTFMFYSDKRWAIKILNDPPKTLFSWFKHITSNVVENEDHEIGSESASMEDESASEDVAKGGLILQLSDEGNCNDKGEREDIFDITLLERDLENRRPICKYSFNERDSIRRAYLVLGPHQPHLSCYPSAQNDFQDRKFCHKWFT